MECALARFSWAHSICAWAMHIQSQCVCKGGWDTPGARARQGREHARGATPGIDMCSGLTTWSVPNRVLALGQTSLGHTPGLECAQASRTWSVPNRVLSLGQTSLGHTSTLECAQASLMALLLSIWFLLAKRRGSNPNSKYYKFHRLCNGVISPVTMSSGSRRRIQIWIQSPYQHIG